MPDCSRWAPRYFSLLLAGIALDLILAHSALAQLPTATISGVVKDPSGAVMPGVAVTITNRETGLMRSSQTGNDGSYRFPALPVGTYEVRAEHTGFQTKVQSGLRIAVGDEAVLNFTLDVGAVTESVSVAAEAPMVNTTSGTLSSLVSEQTVANLPLDGRNFNDLTLLQTGVVEIRAADNSGALNGTQISSNGAPARSNLFMIDGTIMNDTHNTGSASSNENTLGIEGIREFRVVTNAFSAEYGMTMGSQVSLVTKSGTNELHGSVFEYLRNSILDARNWTDAFEKPAFRRNNFGASFGGPIRRDRTFYFLTYEGLRQGRDTTVIETVPTREARQDGGLVPRIAEAVKPYLAFFPLPNVDDPVLQRQGAGRYYHAAPQVQREEYMQGRMDHTLSGSDTLFGRYTIADSNDFRQGVIPEVSSEFPTRNQWFTLSENHIFSPTLLATLRASFSRTRNTAFSNIALPPELAFVPGQSMGTLGITGISGFSNIPGQTPLKINQRIVSVSDDTFYMRGRHTLKFGTLINFYRQFVQGSGGVANVRGVWTFANLAAFLENRPQTFRAPTPGSILFRTYDYETLGFYLQDDLRLTPSFALNLGLRYEFTTQPEEIHGDGAALRDIQHDAAVTPGIPYRNPSKRNLSPRLGFAWDVRGNGKTSLRGGFGLLYDVGVWGTSLFFTAGATPPLSSISTLSPATGLVFGPFPRIPPEVAGRDVKPMDFNIQQPHLLSYNLTLERQLPFNVGLTMAYAGSRGINIMQATEGNPTVPRGTPQGGACLNLSPPPAFRADGPKCWLGTEPRTNPNWDSMDYRTAGGNSWYNSLQMGLQKRLSHALQFQSAYTWSHALDETQGQLPVDGDTLPDDPSDRRHEKASAVFDVRHNWRFNAIYRFPSNLTGGWGKLGKGWWVSGILTWQSGTPVWNLGMSTQRSRSGTLGPSGGAKRPDLVAGVKLDNVTRGKSRGCLGVPAGTPLGTPQMFYDPCAFAIPRLGFLGTAGRNILYGPNFSNLNFSLVKDTPLPILGESGSLQFRTEIFNILNHPALRNPSGVVFAARGSSDVLVEAPLATAGLITGTFNKSREIQFALKILF